MKEAGRILIMDDEAKWRDELGAALQRAGYAVDSAATSREAAMLMQQQLYHVLVLDIRMVDPDESNVEGMDLLAQLEQLGQLDAVAIIMLSAYGTKEQMRQAFRRYNVADFQEKGDFDRREFVESIHQIFVEKVRWNGNLSIYWEGIEGPAQAVIGMTIAGKRVKRGTPPQVQITLELEDLLRKLFHEASSIVVSPMAPGHSGAGVLRVQPFFKGGKGEAVVVKFGHFRMIDQEYNNYKRHVEPFIGGGRHTAVRGLRRTPNLGGIIYSLLGAVGEEIRSFGAFYQKSSLTEIKKTLDQLFHATCANWYESRSTLRPFDLTADYQKLLGFSNESLQRARQERLTSVQGTEHLQFPELGNDLIFINPITALANHHFVRPTYVSITHGDLNDTNVLVDAEGNTWLIDFLRTGEGHILRDIAELDSVVRLQLLGPNDATLAERLAMEEMLAQCTRFSQTHRLMSNFPTENRALVKVFATVVHLRTIAQKIMAQSSDGDISEYHIALMYFALNIIRFYSLPSIQREHALLCASVLAERLRLGTTHG